MITEKEITAGIGNEKARAEAIEDYQFAKDALDSADSMELFRLYEKMIKQRGDLIAVIGVLTEHSEGKTPRIIDRERLPDITSINAIKDVALTAIEFAREVISSNSKPEKNLVEQES